MIAEPRATSDDARRRGQWYVASAAVFWSLAGVLQRGLSVDIPTQMAGRAVFGATFLLVYLVRTNDVGLPRAMRSIGWPGLVVAACMAISSGTFIVALNHTTVANVLFMQALSPFVAVGLAWLLMRERATRRTWMATVVALVGVGLMVGGPGGAPFSGFAITFVMTVSFAFVIVLTRRYRDVSMLPALVIGNSLLVIFVGPFASFGSIDRHDLLFLAVLGLLQTALGQALFAIGARLVPSAEVALITLLEVVLGPLWVWLAYEERPSDATLLGGLIVLVAVVVQATDRALEPIRPAP